MFKIRHTVLFTAVLLLAAVFAMPASALEVTVDPTTRFCFSADDFTAEEKDEGIFITSVPSSNIATVFCGNRALKAGDALTTETLNSLTLQTDCVTSQSATVEYCTISDGKISGVKSLKMSIRPKKNDPPVTDNSNFETYKNIANTGVLDVKDPEGSSMTYTLVTQPKRGTVVLHEDGTFTYTPNKNKVGNDRFEFTATDDAGNVSNPATVNINIKKPTDKETYADMADDPDLFCALWLKDNGLFCGQAVAGHLCFVPEAEVTRGEFLVMVMKLIGADETLTAAASGFADESATPVWMQPYIAQALSNGMISGTSTDDGVMFRPTDAMYKAEAAVMLQNILQLPDASAPVFSSEQETAIPVWAAEAFGALQQAGLDLSVSEKDETLTRRTAASLLYDIHTFMEDTEETFHWTN